jgi:hypothetical protein
MPFMCSVTPSSVPIVCTMRFWMVTSNAKLSGVLTRLLDVSSTNAPFAPPMINRRALDGPAPGSARAMDRATTVT